MSSLRIIFIFSLLFTSVTSAAEPAKPNIVIINIDDMGYADIGPFGSKLNRTPNLDELAKNGRKLTSFYAAPVCSPSRAALMTGCYPKRVLPIPHVLFPIDKHGLDPSEITIAELLKSQGYATAIIGKWHLGDQPEFMPNKQGFDLHYGLPYSNDMGPPADGTRTDLGKPIPKENPKGGQPPLALMRNGEVIKRVLPDDQQAVVELYTNEARDFISKHKDAPFFLYMPHTAVHYPVYPGKAFAGRSPHGIYSDWVEEVDWSVGQVLDALDKNGLREKTLVVFTSDNGGTQRAENRPLRGHKNSTWEGGMRVPTIVNWPGKIPAGTTYDGICGMFDMLPTCAALSGAALPTDRKFDGVDLTPNLFGTPDAKPAHEVFYFFRGLKLEAVRSGDWKLRLIAADADAKGQGAAKKEAAKQTTENKNAATTAAAPPTAPVYQLYDLKTDLAETQNVAAAHPEIVAKLQALIPAMEQDLGTEGIGPGCRKLGLNEKPQPIIPRDKE